MSYPIVNVIKKSINPYNNMSITTVELQYPRIIHNELLTHSALSKNSSSSRAIPGLSLIEYIEEEPFIPKHVHKNKAGMQGTEPIIGEDLDNFLAIWKECQDFCIGKVRELCDKDGLNVHKQIPNRLIENFGLIKVLVTATDWANFYELRNHEAAEPHFHDLAALMQEKIESAIPESLSDGEWHLPYITRCKDSHNRVHYFDSDGVELTFEEALLISVSNCAQVSYRKNDNSLDKANRIWKTLIDSKPRHASPIEHQATPIVSNTMDQQGITHMDRWGVLHSGNLTGWVQYRHYLDQQS